MLRAGCRLHHDREHPVRGKKANHHGGLQLNVNHSRIVRVCYLFAVCVDLAVTLERMGSRFRCHRRRSKRRATAK